MAEKKPKKIRLFDNDKYQKIPCACCGEDLLRDPGLALVQTSRDEDGNLTRFIPCHKGLCDHSLSAEIPKGVPNLWIDMKDMLNPMVHAYLEAAFLNDLKAGKKFDSKAAENYQHVLLATAPYVFREPTDDERSRYEFIMSVPF